MHFYTDRKIDQEVVELNRYVYDTYIDKLDRKNHRNRRVDSHTDG